jgi:hypothetical protein
MITVNGLIVKVENDLILNIPPKNCTENTIPLFGSDRAASWQKY